jgi:hypothetical protein
MDLLVLKLAITPTLIALASLAGRKWGNVISGWLVALPFTAGPIIFFLALSQGEQFAARAAVGTLAGGFSVAAFCLVYASLAQHRRWLSALLGATLAFLMITALLQQLRASVLPLWLAVLASFVVALRLLPQPSSVHDGQLNTLPRPWDIPLRMLVATVFVVLVTTVGPVLGPRLAGLLAPFPLFTAVLAAFAQHQYGPTAAISVLHGLLMGLFAYASFMLTLAVLLVPAGIGPAFAAASVVAIAFQVAAFGLLRRRIG